MLSRRRGTDQGSTSISDNKPHLGLIGYRDPSSFPSLHLWLEPLEHYSEEEHHHEARDLTHRIERGSPDMKPNFDT
jgi:hypothetical protein